MLVSIYGSVNIIEANIANNIDRVGAITYPIPGNSTLW